ncbi:MAG: hypothetical protein V1667_00755 [bacterium]
MKKAIFTILALALLASGCASFGNEAQYDKEGDWWGAASPETVAQIQRDKLALKKLAAEPVQGNAVQGYEGVVANFSNRLRNFYISGPESKSFLLGNRANANWRENTLLLPGVYSYTVMDGSVVVGTGMFRVGPQRSTFLGEKFHWFVYTNK